MSTITLTPAQHAILAHALEHSDGRIDWFPEHIQGGARRKVLDGLANRALIARQGEVWVVADAGYEALGVPRPGARTAPRQSFVAKLDAVIALSYVLILGLIGSLMLTESIRALRRKSGEGMPLRRRKRLHDHPMIRALPFKMRFRKSQLYISALMPLSLGVLVGILAAIMGVGAGFLLVPAMIYLLGMPTAVVVGTSLFQIIFVTANVTMLHAITTQTVDVTLALLLLVGSVIGAQYGVRHGAHLRGEQVRGLLAALVLIVAIALAFELVLTPDDLYFLESGPR